jgi:hypothetical protein
MTNAEIRLWYLERVAGISSLNQQWMEAGYGLETRAQMAWQIRHDARLEARALMPDPVERELVRARDVAVYGNPDGPTFDFLLARAREAGLSGDRCYEAILNGSSRANPDFDRLLG